MGRDGARSQRAARWELDDHARASDRRRSPPQDRVAVRKVEYRNPHFFKTRERYAPAGSAASRAIDETIAVLAEETSWPSAADVATLIPPSLICSGRPVPGTGLLVCYVVGPSVLHVLAIKRAT